MNNVKSLREVGLRPRASASLLFSQGSSSNSGDSWLDTILCELRTTSETSVTREP